MSDKRTSKANKLLLMQERQSNDFDVATLIEWSRDEDSDVRDWATFTLGWSDYDSVDVRRALRLRLEDEDFDTLSEAFVGLARRQDEAAVEPLLRALESDHVGMQMVEAAGYFGRAEFVPVLRELEGWWDVDPELLEGAINRCSGKYVRRFATDIFTANDQ